MCTLQYYATKYCFRKINYNFLVCCLRVRRDRCCAAVVCTVQPDVDVFILAIWLAALHHNFIIITIFFFISFFSRHAHLYSTGKFLAVCWRFAHTPEHTHPSTHTQAHTPEHTHRHIQIVFYSSVIWCVCVGRSCNYFILVFQFRNDNNNLPAAKPKIKFTPIQNKMEFALCALFVFAKTAVCNAIICCFVPLFICVLNFCCFFLSFVCFFAGCRYACSLTSNKIYYRTISALPTLYAYMHVCSIGVSLLNLLIYTCTYSQSHIYQIPKLK